MIKRKTYISLLNYDTKIVDGVKVCLECDKPLPRARRKYCSDECSFEFLAKHSHGDMKIKLMRDRGHICEHCNTKTSDLILDHIEPISLGGAEFDTKNLQLLCQDCDRKKTKKDMGIIAKARKIERATKENKTLEGKWE